jgi:hypothetical protein
MGDIYQAKMSDSRREFEKEIQNLIIAHSEEIYKLKRKIRKRDLSINELQKRMDFALRTLSVLKDKFEGKFE